MATWPATLPDPLLGGYGFTPLDQTIRTDMEVGSPRVRRRTNARVDTVSVSWTFTAAQMAEFRTFFDDNTTGLAGGVAWVTINLDVGEGAFQSCEARFIGPWQATRNAQYWNVSARLEVR